MRDDAHSLSPKQWRYYVWDQFLHVCLLCGAVYDRRGREYGDSPRGIPSNVQGHLALQGILVSHGVCALCVDKEA